MTQKSMPSWVADKLIRDGVMTTDRVTKHARPRRCKTCWLFTLVGLDEISFRAVVDPQPTTTPGEAFALLCGRASYLIDGDELFARTAWRMQRRADDHPVYIEHRCGSPRLPINERFISPPVTDQEGTPPF